MSGSTQRRRPRLSEQRLTALFAQFFCVLFIFALAQRTLLICVRS